jgi:NAD(P)H-dependent FMN reductase
MRILGISGSLQAGSGNLALVQLAARKAPAGVNVEIFDGIRDLPPFNPDLEAGGAPPAAVTRWRSALAGADGVFISCPEYAFSVPGALKNAIDWVIGSGELEGKVVAMTAAVPAVERGRRGLAALREALTAVRATIVGGDPIARGDRFEADVTALMLALVAAVEGRRASATG